MLVTSGLNPGLLDRVLELDIPIVAVDREVPGLAVDTVTLDNTVAAQLAAEHLLEHGHSMIACIGGPPHLPNTVQRVNGYRQALQLRGIQPQEDLVRTTEFTIGGGYEAGKRLLGDGLRPTAIVTGDDQIAVGVLHAARDLGIDVPQELAVVGFDDTFVAKICSPRLTTIAQPVAEISRLAISRLLERINGTISSPHRRKALPGRLVVRESCGCKGEADFR